MEKIEEKYNLLKAKNELLRERLKKILSFFLLILWVCVLIYYLEE
jgi:hypothetical protein